MQNRTMADTDMQDYSHDINNSPLGSDTDECKQPPPGFMVTHDKITISN